MTGSDNYLLHIVSLETGQDSTYIAPGSYSSLGELVWSPDNRRLAFQAVGMGWTENPKVGFSLGMFDIETEKITTLVSNDVRRFRPVKWFSNQNLLLSGKSGDGQSFLDYQLDVSTNQIMIIPEATPTP